MTNQELETTFAASPAHVGYDLTNDARADETTLTGAGREALEQSLADEDEEAEDELEDDVDVEDEDEVDDVDEDDEDEDDEEVEDLDEQA